jgi:hypothetical protein
MERGRNLDGERKEAICKKKIGEVIHVYKLFTKQGGHSQACEIVRSSTIRDHGQWIHAMTHLKVIFSSV